MNGDFSIEWITYPNNGRSSSPVSVGLLFQPANQGSTGLASSLAAWTLTAIGLTYLADVESAESRCASLRLEEAIVGLNLWPEEQFMWPMDETGDR